MTFFEEISSIRIFFTKRDAFRYGVLLILMITGALLESVGVGAIPAFVTVIVDPSALSSNRWIGQWVPELPETPSAQLVTWASLLLFAVIFVKNIFLSFVGYLQSQVVEKQRRRLADKMFQVYQQAPYEWHLGRSSSELLRNISSDTQQILIGVLAPMLELIMSCLMAMFVIGVMLLGSTGPVFVSILINGLGILLIVRSLQKHLRRIGQIRREEHKESFKAIQQAFASLVESRLLQRESHFFKVFRSSNSRFTRACRIQATIERIMPNIMETITVFGLLIVIALMMQSGVAVEALIPTISLLAIGALRLKQLAQKISHAVNSLNAGRAFIPGIVEDYRELEKIRTTEAASRSADRIPSEFQEMVLENITYRYPSAHESAIKNFSLQLCKGESIAFVGQTGCGKTTLVNLILGLLAPTEGEVKVNGVDIHSDRSGWWKQLAYVPQSIYLIDDSIRSNVAFGLPRNEIVDGDVWAALRSARLEEFVRSLPEGLDTVVGERGVRLSGGQRQRIGIARALFVKPQVLVMDEATSALDNKTEDEVKQAIANLRDECTLIMIAHRLSTVQDCDRVYFLQDGRIEESGSFEEIREKSDTFREFVGDSIGSTKPVQTVGHET